MEAMNCLGDVLTWIQVPFEKPAQNQLSVQETFYKAFDVSAQDHWRIIANVKEEKFEQRIDTLEINGEEPSISVDSKLA